VPNPVRSVAGSHGSEAKPWWQVIEHSRALDDVMTTVCSRGALWFNGHLGYWVQRRQCGGVWCLVATESESRREGVVFMVPVTPSEESCTII